jgi:hypothetical protein
MSSRSIVMRSPADRIARFVKGQAREPATCGCCQNSPIDSGGIERNGEPARLFAPRSRHGRQTLGRLREPFREPA